MTEGEKAFCRRRIREELAKANAPENYHLRKLHLRWALLYQQRLGGKPLAGTQRLETQVREAGFDREPMTPVLRGIAASRADGV